MGTMQLFRSLKWSKCTIFSAARAGLFGGSGAEFSNMLCKTLVVLHRQGRTDEARSLPHELFGLRNELLTQLHDLVMGVDSKIKAT